MDAFYVVIQVVLKPNGDVNKVVKTWASPDTSLQEATNFIKGKLDADADQTFIIFEPHELHEAVSQITVTDIEPEDG